MKLKHIAFLFLGILVMYSCNDSTTTYDADSVPTDAQISSFSIAASHKPIGDSISRAEDSIRFIQFNKTKFAIDQVTGRIFNPDSLPYGLKLDKVALTLTYSSAYGVASLKITTPDSINGYYWNSSDSVSFSKQPITFQSTALSGATKTYNIDILIHKVDPELMSWKKMENLPLASAKQKTILIGNDIYLFTNASNKVSLHKRGITATGWNSVNTSGLPSNVDLESIVLLDKNLYARTDDGKSYTSTNNGETWSNIANNKYIAAIYGVLPSKNGDKLLIAIKENDNYYYALTNNLTESSIETTNISGRPTGDSSISSDFPISNFSSVVSNQNNYLIVVAGKHGTSELNTTWLVEAGSNGIEISASSRNSLFKGSGVSAFMYNEQLYAFSKNKLYVSSSWGENWAEALSKQQISATATVRKSQNAFVDTKNNIWILGGVSTSGASLSDVWQGHLNSLGYN